MLTKKQYQLLLLIRDRMNRDGVAPSFDEMKDALQLKSKSGIHRLIGSLEERGFLRRLPHKARALEVLKLPDSASDRPASGFAPNIISGNFGISGATAKTSSPVETVELPLYGKIAAGTPIEALRNPLEHIGVPAGLLGTGEHYALTIIGDRSNSNRLFRINNHAHALQSESIADNGHTGEIHLPVSQHQDDTTGMVAMRDNGSRLNLAPMIALI